MEQRFATGENTTVRGWGPRPHAGIAASLFLSSAALLLLEISLTRFFSFTIWYHFAYLTISAALLGFGSSGALVAAFPDFIRRRGQDFLVASLVLSAVITVAGLAFLARFPIEVRNLTQEPLHFSLSLAVYYLIVGAPFLLAGFSVSVPFAAYPERMSRLYFWDLLGAATGCALVVLFIELLGVPGLIILVAALLLASAAALSFGGGRRAPAAVLAPVAIVLAIVAGPAGHRLPVSITASKTFSPANVTPATVGPPVFPKGDHFSRWTAINRVDAFGWATPSTDSFWSRFGISPTWTGQSRPLVARVTYDGSNGSDIYSFTGDVERDFEMFDHHLLKSPYLLLERPNVLVIGVGGGVDMVNAVKQGARHVTGAELQPVTVWLLKDHLKHFTGGFYSRDDVTLVTGEGRHFVRKHEEVFDLIQITGVDTFAAQSTGAYVLAESYLYTVEAVEDYLARLSDDGIVSMVIGDIVMQGSLPPLGTRMALLGYRALEARGVADPGRHILVLGASAPGGFSEDQIVMVAKKPYDAGQIETMRQFAAASGFRLVYAPGEAASRLSALLGSDESVRQRVLDEEWFHVEATHDSNPFFYNVGKWSNLSPTKSSYFIMPGSFMGQVVLLIMVAQSVLFGALLIVVPLLRGAREGLRAPRVASYLAYFLSVGVGFMFIEISSVQASVLFLGSPTYALSVTILALLLFLGIGSNLSSRFTARPEWALGRLMFAAALLAGLFAVGLAPLFNSLLYLDLPWRIVVAILVQLPMGLILGMFMPLGVACVARENPRLVPWAWGINGVGSVVGTTLAVLLAMAAGFPAVSLAAGVLYLAGTSVLIRARAA